MTNSMFYLPFVLLSFGVGGLKPTTPILKAENVQTLPVYLNNLSLIGFKNSTNLFLGGQKIVSGQMPPYILSSLDIENEVWELPIEIIDSTLVGIVNKTRVEINGFWTIGNELQPYNVSIAYNNNTDDYFSFSSVIEYNYDSNASTSNPQQWTITEIHIIDTPIVQRPYEVIDIPSVIFTIFTLPFTFMTKAFDVTIFPGTPFQINFSNLVMLILGGITFIYLIHFLFKTFR